MSSSDAAAWAQAILSGLAILVSGAFAVLVPWWERRENAKKERRARLSVTTTLWEPSGLKLRFDYLPEFMHVGMHARVTLLGREGFQLHDSKFAHSPGMLTDGTYLLHQLGGLCLGGKGSTRLASLNDGPYLTGIMYLLPFPDLQFARPVDKARIRVEIVTDSHQKLLSEELTVSAITLPLPA